MTGDLAERVQDVHSEGRDDPPSRPAIASHLGMVFIPGGTFRMGSDRHLSLIHI